MKKTLILASTGVLALAFTAFNIGDSTTTEKQTSTPIVEIVKQEKIQWMSFEEAMAAHEANPKKIFIDFYTDWCGWCKTMDKKTFTDPAVVAYMNENYYAIKFDAEQKETVHWKGKTFDYIPSGKRGVHALAYTLLDQKLSYPAFVFMTDDLAKKNTLHGYAEKDAFLKKLKNPFGTGI